MFWRVFMRISYVCPTHLKFAMDIEQWSTLIKLTSESIDWLDAHEAMYDVWLVVAYAATSCALVQVSMGSHGTRSLSYQKLTRIGFFSSITPGRGAKTPQL